MIAVESTSVPSQSKTIKRNAARRLGQASAPVRSRRVEPRDERARGPRGSGASSASAPRSPDARTPIRCACRNIRFSPCLASALFQAKSPYLSSPASGKPEVRQVHADLVRAPGLELGFEQRHRRVAPGQLAADEHGARGSALAHRPAPGARRRRSRTFAATARPRGRRRASCREPAPDSACRCGPRAAARAARPARRAAWRRSSTPEVSRSSRWTSSRNFASGRACRNRSITPWLMPLPPCTASPPVCRWRAATSSSNRMAESGRRRPGAGPAASGAAARTGGRRDAVAGDQPGLGTDPVAVDPAPRRCAGSGRRGSSAPPSAT